MSLASAQRPAADDASSADSIARIVAVMRGWSIEATQPKETEVATLKEILTPGTNVYLSAVPTRDPAMQIAPAVALAAAGLAPVPHIAVRAFADVAAFDGYLARMSQEAGVRGALVISGDRDQPAGPFRDAIEAIDSGILQRHGIRHIGIAGYPDGHERISEQELDRALRAKIGIADEIGLDIHIVTQFGFDASRIIAWIERVRDFGIELPVRIGLAGPTNIATLLRYAQRCGVRASAQGLARQSGLARHMFGMSAPDALVRALADAGPRLGDVALHFFSFGGIAATARWASAVAAGRITIDAAGGFQVTPPSA